MLKKMTPEFPMILSVVAQLLAVIAALWVIWPLRVGPIYYSEQSIVDVHGLSVLALLFAPSALILAGTFALYIWATRGSAKAKIAAWAAAFLIFIVLAVNIGAGLFFLPAAATMLLAPILQSRLVRDARK